MSNKVKVKFLEVGLFKDSWDAGLTELSFEELEKAVKTRGALMSNDIEFTYDEETSEGIIFVGGFRAVGTFQVFDNIH